MYHKFSGCSALWQVLTTPLRMLPLRLPDTVQRSQSDPSPFLMMDEAAQAA